MKTLETLYYGILHSSEYDISYKKEYQHLLGLIVRHEEVLAATLTDTQKETFDKFKDCADEFHGINELKAFTNGFILATNIMMEVVTAKT